MSERIVEPGVGAAGDVGTAPPAPLTMGEEAPAGALPELEKRRGAPFGRIAAVADEQIIDVDHGSRLQQRLDEIEHRDGGLIEVAVDRHQRDLALLLQAALQLD